MLVSAAMAPAQTDRTWTGSNASQDDWNRRQNWSSNNEPNGSTERARFNTDGLLTSIEVTAADTTGGIIFTSNLSDSITFYGSGDLTLLNTYGLNTASEGTQTFSVPLSISSTQTWSNTSTSGSLILSGGINLNSASLIFLSSNAGADITADSVISGTGGLTQSGSGTLNLSGINTYAGSTSVSAGTLSISSANALGTTGSGTTVSSGATLALAGSGTTFAAESLTLNGTGASGAGALANTSGNNTYTGNISLASASTVTVASGTTLTTTGTLSGTGNLTKSGAGILDLSSGSNSFSGSTTVSAGTLRASAAGALGSTSGVTVNSGGTLALATSSGTYTPSLTLNGTGTASSGALANTTGANTWSGNITLASSSSIDVAAGSSLDLSGTVSGSAGLTKSSTGTLTLSGSNSYSGATTISAGTLIATTDTALGTSAAGTTVASGATLQLENNISITGEALTNNGQLTNASGTNSFSGTISGSGDVLLSGGQLTLSGTNTFSGDVTVNSGSVLVATSDDALGSGGGTTTIQSGGTLQLTGGIDVDTETGITLAGTGTSGQGAVLSSSGDNILDSVFSLAGDTTISATADSLTVGTQGTSPLFELNGYDVTFNTDGGDINFEADFTDAGDVYKTGSGTLSLNHSEAYPVPVLSADTDFYLQDGTTILNTYNNEDVGILGDVVVGDGIGAAGSAVFQQGHTESGNGYLFNNLISDSSNITINSDGYWDLQGYKEIVNDVTMNGGTIEATNGSGTGDRLDIIGTLTATGGTTATIEGRLGMNNDTAKSIVVDSGATLDINAVLSNGGFDKTGDGTLVLSGANSFTGTAKISDGIVRVDNDSGLGAVAGGTQVLSGGQLQLDGVTIGAESLQIAGSGHNNDGTGALRALAGTTNTWGGNVLMTANARIVTATGADLTIDGNITGSGTTLDVESIGDTTFNGNNTFNTLNKTGAGTLTVTGNNTYANNNIDSGTYALGASNILSDTMDVNLGASGTFNVGSYTDVIDDLNGSGTLTIASGGDLTIDQIGNSGAFTGTLNIDGILTLNGGTIGAADGSASTGTMELTAGNTLNIVDDFNFGGTLLLADNTTLNLVNDGTTFDLGTLRVTGDSVIDFSGSDVGTFNIGTLEIDLGGTIYATSWNSFYDLWTATNFNGATLDARNSTTAQITFEGFTASDTIWLTYDYGANEITVPEPSTYGFLLMSALGGLYALRRRKQSKSKVEA
ncbi:autotransporter-associated beta strand repeat-containing protein [Actomonas aquatica]|uniref:Autotransporter-associated beta strand repeat-containing protein n=1 Tax=Actomonas aquatica TaxID=2866162 RepID=A0ABZ1CDM3_9BACT|nr:autotransporter-associated beta strand repeat-containing protein [Opitutus sp. WL0086]WRQ89706.1 autotransporter-associated beta strand repeat-containing protein [Opitutus sp. WL0086]